MTSRFAKGRLKVETGYCFMVMPPGLEFILWRKQALSEIEMPVSLDEFKLPRSVNQRLQTLLDCQDNGDKLTSAEKKEAEGLVDLSEMLTLLRLRSQRVWRIDV